MEYKKYEMFQQGIYIEYLTKRDNLERLIKRLHPIKSQFELERFGDDYDGGYLLPRDLKDIAVCFSPGVDVIASFEMALLSRMGIPSHFADYSVDAAPIEFKTKSFIKKNLGSVNDDKYITLDNWVRSSEEFGSDKDFLLQMDIEGAEYTSILGVSEEVLNRFRIIVIEIHNIESWGQPDFFNILVNPFFKKLLKYFYVVHNHPNNCCGIVNLGGVLAPRVFELTLIRKDRCVPLGFSSQFPHPLDRKNVLNNADITLPDNWFRSKEQIQNTRYVLCRPQGGLTDQLSQIGKCIYYAEKYDRTLIIDTNTVNFHGLKDEFSKYFLSKDPLIRVNYLDRVELLNKPMFPKLPSGDLNNYQFFIGEHNRCYLDNSRKLPLTFNFVEDYHETVLFHQQPGSDTKFAIYALSKFILHENILNELKRRVSLIGENYLAIHIRNTDIKTDYDKILVDLEKIDFSSLFISSDDFDVIQKFKEKFGTCIYSFSNIPRSMGKATHINNDPKDTYSLYQDAICDLIMLGMSSRLIILKVNDYSYSEYSGFSKLALLLNKDKDVIRSLISVFK